MTSELSDAIASWVDGWTLSRGSGRPEPVPEGYFIRVGVPGEDARLVVRGDSRGNILSAAASIDAPNVWLKIPGEPAHISGVLGDRWRIGIPLFFMTKPLGLSTPAALPPGFELSVNAEPGAVQVRITDESTQLAARGRMGLGANAAVFDQIRTEDAFARRGLGSVVMRALESLALERGARSGILMATVAGRALYEHLDWRVLTPFTEAVLA